MELFFDTETSGFPTTKYNSTDPKQAWIVQLGFVLSTKDKIYAEYSALAYPDSSNGERSIHYKAFEQHGFTIEDCMLAGVSEELISKYFDRFINNCTLIVAHNYDFDTKMVDLLFRRVGYALSNQNFIEKPHICTMKNDIIKDYAQIPYKPDKNGRTRNGWKWPKLEELYMRLFGEEIIDSHTALSDARATRRCYYELVERGVL